MNIKNSIELHLAHYGDNPPPIRIVVDKITAIRSEGPELPNTVIFMGGDSFTVEETYNEIVAKVWAITE